MLESIVKAGVPRIEQKCNADLCQFNKKDGAQEAASGPPIFRTEIGQRKLGDLSEGTAATAHSINSLSAECGQRQRGGNTTQARRLMEQPPRDAIAHFLMVDPVWLAVDDRNCDVMLSLVALDHDERVLAPSGGCL